ncbi:MAG: glutamate 5-kinase, partial [Lachnospiraceae bacterium]|nr:glutamate 5-kinase [Lachnospiraceae bacterium]
VATSEIAVGDNDTLSAIVASLVGADLLILLSDVDGLYSDDPHIHEDAKFIPLVEKLDDKIISLGKGTTGSRAGTGGMQTKLFAAQIAVKSGCDMLILSGEDMHIIHRIIDGADYGTLFQAQPDPTFDLQRHLLEQ